MSFSTLSVQGFSHLVLFDASGHRSYGLLAAHAPESLRSFDTYLDSLDAANELPDGTLPHEVPALVGVPA